MDVAWANVDMPDICSCCSQKSPTIGKCALWCTFVETTLQVETKKSQSPNQTLAQMSWIGQSLKWECYGINLWESKDTISTCPGAECVLQCMNTRLQPRYVQVTACCGLGHIRQDLENPPAPKGLLFLLPYETLWNCRTLAKQAHLPVDRRRTSTSQMSLQSYTHRI